MTALARAARRLPALAALLLAGLSGGAALACKCVQPITAAGSYRQAELVVLGTVTAVEVLDAASQTTRAAIAVERSWKSAPPAALAVVSDGTCAVGWAAGERFVIYLRRVSAQDYATDRCSGTATEARARGLLRWLARHGRRTDGAAATPAR